MIKLGIITFLEKYKFYRTKGSLAELLTFIKVIFLLSLPVRNGRVMMQDLTEMDLK